MHSGRHDIYYRNRSHITILVKPGDSNDTMRTTAIQVMYGTFALFMCGEIPLPAREGVRLDLESSIRSRFVWRGEMWTDDPVFWQTVTLRWRNFRSYNFFNVDLTDINGERYELNEYDYILDYTFRFRHFSAAPGVLHFSSPTNFFKPSTKITLDLRVFSGWNPRLRVRIDTEHSRGSYYIFSAARRLALPGGRLAVDLAAELGLSQPRYYRSHLSSRIAATDALLGAYLPLDLGKGYTLTPFAEFTSLLDHSVREAQEATGARKDAVTFGVVMGKGVGW